MLVTKRFALATSLCAVLTMPVGAAAKDKPAPVPPEPIERRLGLIYRKDKAFSKAGLGFIEVVTQRAGLRRAEPGPRASPPHRRP